MGTRRLGAYLAVMGVAAAGSFLLPDAAGGVARLAVAVAGIGCLVGAILVYRPSRRAGWWLVALSGSLTFGEAVVIAATSGLGAGERLTTVPQLIFAILALLALAAGLAVLGWRSPKSGWLNTLDVAIIATGAFLLVWVFYIDPTLMRSATHFAILVAIVLPAGSLLVFAMAVKLAFGGGLSTWSGGLLLVAVASGLCIAGLLVLPIGAPAVPIDLPILAAWLAHMILLGAVSIAPGFTAVVGDGRQPTGGELPIGRVVLFVLLALVAPLNVAVGFSEADAAGPSFAAIVVPPACGTLILLILVARLVLVARVASRQAEELGRRSDSLSKEMAKRSDLERELTYRALHDPLTGLANRDAFTGEMERLHDAYRGHHGVSDRGQALIMLDLDGFKEVNDTMGHPAGDQVLVDVAQRLVGCVGEQALVGRLGGDEFVVLLENTPPDGARGAAEAIRQTVRTPFSVAGREVFLSASIGLRVTESGTCPPSSSEGLRDADQALYEAKEARDRVVEYHSKPLAQQLYQASMSSRLREAVGREELILDYQPIVRLDDERIVAVEALVRWRQEGGEIISPTQFLPIAEQTGAIAEIDAWVLRQACRDARVCHWQHGTAVAVNLSSHQLEDPNFPRTVVDVLAQAALPGESLILEVDEGSITESTTDPAVLARLDGLRDEGVRVAINDFGAGRSSPSTIARLPVDLVKIDSSFARGAAGSPGPQRDPAFVRATLARIDEARLAAVAVGVESREQADALRQLNCPYAQGYYFCPPLPANRIGELLKARAAALRRRK